MLGAHIFLDAVEHSMSCTTASNEVENKKKKIYKRVAQEKIELKHQL